MAEAYELTIDINLLGEHLTAADGHEWTNSEVCKWLEGTGFKQRGETWIAEELTLDALDRSEFRIIRRL